MFSGFARKHKRHAFCVFLKYIKVLLHRHFLFYLYIIYDIKLFLFCCPEDRKSVIGLFIIFCYKEIYLFIIVQILHIVFVYVLRVCFIT